MEKNLGKESKLSGNLGCIKIDRMESAMKSAVVIGGSNGIGLAIV